MIDRVHGRCDDGGEYKGTYVSPFAYFGKPLRCDNAESGEKGYDYRSFEDCSDSDKKPGDECDVIPDLDLGGGNVTAKGDEEFHRRRQ